ncbi:hypothetical protein CDD83_2817 [Cordyceps sp. RAO-2017]|nr:hypothetical protein CDD83_2817 [Cordyceps sp. RAO-2017]
MSLSAFVVPVFLDTHDDANKILQQWACLYLYGRAYLPALCVATCGFYGYIAVSRRRVARWYALAAVSTFAMVPFTWLAMTPTNNTLFGLAASASPPNLSLVRGLLVRWAWLHVTRSLAPLIGAFVGLASLLRELRVQ